MSGRLPPAVTTVDELNEVVDAIRESGIYAFDVETRGNIHNHPEVMQLIEDEWAVRLETLKTTNTNVIARSRQAIEDRWTKDLALDPLRNEVTWISLAISGESWAIPISHPNGEVLVPGERGDGSTVPPLGYRVTTPTGKESMAKAKYFIPAVFSPPPQQLPASVVWEALEPIFMDPSIPQTNQNLVFDCRSVAKYIYGLPKGDYIELMDLQHIVDENLLGYSLEENIHRNFQQFDPYHRDGKLGKHLDTVSFSQATYYGHLDARWAWLTYKKLWRRISTVPSLMNCVHLDTAAIRPMAQATHNGILVNKREMVKFGKELEVDLNHKLVDMAEYAPIGFNPDSNDHKRHLFFGKKREGGLGLKSKKKTPGGAPSVDAKVMGSLKGEHPMVDMMLDYAELQKLKTTFVDGMIPKLHNGRAHPNFWFHRTVTSRISCTDPNLQNQSRDDRIRDLFMAEKGNSLLVADYSAIELRILGALANDTALKNIFLNDIDPHTGTAAGILKKPVADVTHEERVIYGKAQPLDSLVLTPYGWVTMGEVTVGDEVVDPLSGQGVKVCGVYPQGVRRIAKVTFNDGTAVRCDYEHLWAVSRQGKRLADVEGVASLSVIEKFMKSGPSHHLTSPIRVPLSNPVMFPTRTLPLDPYIVGALLGDGGLTQAGVNFASADPGILDRVCSALPAHWDLRPTSDSRGISFTINQGSHKGTRGSQLFSPQSVVSAIGIFGSSAFTKRVPPDYLFSSLAQRLALLQGLLDTDGTVSPVGQIEFTSASLQLADDVTFLARSLGMKVCRGTRISVANHMDYRVRISSVPSAALNPFYLERKATRVRVDVGQPKSIVSIEEDGCAEAQCISVDSPSRLYITDGFTVTHNTVNFCINYGGGAKRIRETAKNAITLEEAEAIVDGYDAAFPELAAWKLEMIRKAKRLGYAETQGGRRRRLPDLKSDNKWDVLRAERQVVNHISQGTAAEICKRAIVATDAMLEYPRARLLLQVHDELVLSVPTDEINIWQPKLLTAMGHGEMINGLIPLHVSSNFAGTWGKAK